MIEKQTGQHIGLGIKVDIPMSINAVLKWPFGKECRLISLALIASLVVIGKGVLWL